MHREMNLYKVTSRSKELYIVAEVKAKAIEKFVNVTSEVFHSGICCEMLCRRDEIIPTVDPRREFQE